MSINRWRYVRYTDDGCSIYECLQCYSSWEGRGAPGYLYEGKYHPTWHFCPICGTQWLGVQSQGCETESRERQVGPRRRKIFEAIDRRHDAQRETFRYTPPYWFVIETAERHCRDGETELKWEPESRMSGTIEGAAKQMLNIARDDLLTKQEDQANRERPDADTFAYFQHEFFARVVVVSDLEKRYPHRRIREIRG